MSQRLSGPMTVVEWSPNGLRVCDPSTGRIESFASVADAGSAISGKRVVLALSRRSCFVKAIRVPNVPKAEALLALRYQIGQHLPLDPGEASFDLVMSADASGDGRLAVLYAVRTDALKDAKRQIEDAGAKVVTVTASCIGSACLQKEVGSDTYEVAEETPEGLAIDVCVGGVVQYTRLVPLTPELDLHDEVHRTCGIVGRKPAGTVGAGGFDAPGLARSLPLSGLKALAERNPDTINIEIPEEVEARARKAVSTKARTAVLLFAAAAAAAFLVYSDYETAASERATLAARAARQTRDDSTKNKALTSDLAALKKKSAILDQAFDPAQPFSDVLIVVSEAAPAGVWLTGANMERGKPLTFRGTAISDQAVKTFLDGLAVTDRLREVKLLFANNATIEETPVVNFSVQATLVGNLPMVEKEKKKGSAAARVARN